MTAMGVDPRTPLPARNDVRPIVVGTRAPIPTWVLAVAAVVAAVILFAVLNTRRQQLAAPSTRARASDLARLPAAPPTLFIPPEQQVFDTQPTIVPTPSSPIIPVAPPAQPQPAPVLPSVTYGPPANTTSSPLPAPPPRSGSPGTALVIDTTDMASPSASEQGPASTSESATGGLIASGRVRAGQFVNRATTVPQGTLISAVLETALDSTRPGQVRALVSRDVRGFDGTRVLIPRGSRLLGEYRADLQLGQNRALVQWTRLIRTDGVTIAIGSPAADPLGRAGLRGKVNSHFFERFGSMILQSTLDIGVGVATQRVGGRTLVVLPGTLQSTASSVIPTRQIQPTLTVKQGARVTVFVARDLDFTSARAE